MMEKADYSRIASFYDRGRGLSEQNTELWLDLIARLSGVPRGGRALDLGCGTGRFALPMARDLGYRVTGADLSAQMLDRARAKDAAGLVTWILADASALELPPGSFDLVFMSHLLHHVDDPARVLRECLRILSPSGTVLVRYGAIEQIRADVEHVLFPGALEIDEPRTPTVEATEGWLAAAGFSRIASQEVVQRTYRDGPGHLEAARAQSTSVLTMIPEESYRLGLRRLAEHVREHPRDDWLLYDKMTITAGVAAEACPTAAHP